MQTQMEPSYLKVGINQLRPNTWNPNAQTDFIFDKELNSIATFGFIDPITVRQTDDPNVFEIVDGEHRWKAAKHLGLTEVPITNLGNVPNHLVQQLTVILNETKGTFDDKKMGELLTELMNTPGLSIDDLRKNLPFTELEFDTLVNKVDIDWDQIDPNLSAPGEIKPDDFEEIKLMVPEGIAEQFWDQLHRIKVALYPDQDPKDVSYILPLEAMIQHVAQIPDDQLV